MNFTEQVMSAGKIRPGVQSVTRNRPCSSMSCPIGLVRKRFIAACSTFIRNSKAARHPGRICSTYLSSSRARILSDFSPSASAAMICRRCVWMISGSKTAVKTPASPSRLNKHKAPRMNCCCRFQSRHCQETSDFNSLISGAKTELSYQVDSTPLEISIDPDYDLLRTLSAPERSAVWSSIMGGEHCLTVLSEEDQKDRYKSFIELARALWLRAQSRF